jgi:branched-chain amino acid transport system ATP-binding protein
MSSAFISGSATLLSVREIDVFYGDFHVLHSVSLEVAQGEIVAVVGANGHGKSTLLKTICGLVPTARGDITFKGRSIHGRKASDLVGEGIAYVAEDRRLFPDMTVRENLMLGAYPAHARARKAENLQLVLTLYPRLAERQSQLARTLSGGEAQMLALGRGLMSAPELLAIDEPSLGLAPNLVEAMLDTIATLNKQGLTILLVEQSLALIEGLVSRVHTLEEGVLT